MGLDIPASGPEAPEDEMWERWKEYRGRSYADVFYDGSALIRRIGAAGHRMLERPHTASDGYRNVLEVGGGGHPHLPHVRHRFDRYIVGDLDLRMLGQVLRSHGANPRVEAMVLDGRRLPYANHTFDRVISIYTLEHLTDPHLVLKEWARVLKPGGILSIAIPTEGGLAWTLGRYFSTRRTFRRMGFDYDYIVAREHVNTCGRLLALIRHYFADREECWYPTGVPSPNFNLVFATTIRASKTENGAASAQGGTRTVDIA